MIGGGCNAGQVQSEMCNATLTSLANSAGAA